MTVILSAVFLSQLQRMLISCKHSLSCSFRIFFILSWNCCPPFSAQTVLLRPSWFAQLWAFSPQPHFCWPPEPQRSIHWAASCCAPATRPAQHLARLPPPKLVQRWCRTHPAWKGLQHVPFMAWQRHVWSPRGIGPAFLPTILWSGWLPDCSKHSFWRH